MAVVVDTGNAVSQADTGGATTNTISVTVASDVNCLLVNVSGINVDASGVTLGAAGFTQLGTGPNFSVLHQTAWYLLNPSVGTATITVTKGSTSNISFEVLPLKNVNTSSPFSAVTTNSSSSNNNPTVTVTGGGANDLYFGIAHNGNSSQTAGGAPQVSLIAITAPASTSFSVADIPGSSTGTFTWTGSGTGTTNLWSAYGFVAFGIASGALAGTAALTFGQTGNLKGAGALTGISTLTFGQTGALKGAGALTGSTALTFGQAGVLTGAGALAGTASITFDASGTPNPPVSFIAGTATLIFGASGTLIQPVAGTNDNVRIADTVNRRRKLKRSVQTAQPVFIAPASFEIAPPPEVIARVPNFISLAQAVGKPMQQLRAEVDEEIRVLMESIQERDDDEALQWILSVID